MDATGGQPTVTGISMVIGGAPIGPAATAVAVNVPAVNAVTLPSAKAADRRGKLMRTTASGMGLPAASYAVTLNGTATPVVSSRRAGSATSFATGTVWACAESAALTRITARAVRATFMAFSPDGAHHATTCPCSCLDLVARGGG